MAQDRSSGSSTKFIALESCRGICAILVTLVHLSANGYFYDLPFIRHGDIGVTYFFVLSGFVMTHAYATKLRSGADFVPFVIRRFGRLYPLHIAILAGLIALEFVKLALVSGRGVSAGVPPFSGANSLPALAGNIFLINGLGFFDDFTWNGPSWTISTEFWVYLVFFLVLMARSRVQLVAIVLVFVTGAALLANEALGLPLKTIKGQGALSCVYCFFIGMLTYAATRRWRDALDNVPAAEWIALIVAALAFLDLVPFRSVLNPPLLAFVLAVLSMEKGSVSKALQHRPVVYLGTISYSIYMVHFTVLSVLNGVARILAQKSYVRIIQTGNDGGFLIDTGQRWHMDLLAIAYLIVVIAIASVTYRMIEVPFRTRFNKIADRVAGRREASPREAAATT